MPRFDNYRQRINGVVPKSECPYLEWASLGSCKELRCFVTDVEGRKIGVRRHVRSVKISITIKVVSKAPLSWTREYIPVAVTDEVTASGDQGCHDMMFRRKISVG